jgi:hypothetical protein
LARRAKISKGPGQTERLAQPGGGLQAELAWQEALLREVPVLFWLEELLVFEQELQAVWPVGQSADYWQALVGLEGQPGDEARVGTAGLAAPDA